MPDVAPRTPPALLACMMGLVLSNIVFVQLTEAAEPTWLAPLYALALAAPMLARFKENVVYRVLWNAAVVAFFGRLLQHAMSADLAFVLQDGLLLAVLCQVHLLNNLRAEQRPDLLFLNSYLIAIITGYITVDLEFAAAFLVYAPFFVIGMQFRVIGRADRDLPSEDVRRISLDGAMRSAVLLGMTLVAFLVWPRDFKREALFSDYFDFTATSDSYDVDFSETLQARKRKGRVQKSQRVVLTAELMEGATTQIPTLWRGATLSSHKRGGSWAVANEPPAPMSMARDPDWRERWNGLSLDREVSDAVDTDEDEPLPTTRFRVIRKGGTTQRLFLPRDTQSIDLDPIHRAGRLVGATDGTVRYSNPGELRYEIVVSPEHRTPVEGPIDSEDLEPFLALVESLRTQSAVGLARDLRKKLPEDADELAVANLFARTLSTRYSYRLPGEEGGAATLHEFLSTDSGGHCELFASALTTMLRSVDVPARIVTGYRSGSWDPETSTVTVRALNAHAWVEVFSPGQGGWFSIDPTPAGGFADGGPSLWERTRTSLADLWARMTSFDADARKNAVAWVRTSPERAWAAMKARPEVPLGLSILLIYVAVMWHRIQRRKQPEQVRVLVTAFRKAGLPMEAHETPREALVRARSTELDETVSLGLAAAVEEHERSRYAA